MSKEKVNSSIKELFSVMNDRVADIIKKSSSSDAAAKKIVTYVSGEIAAKSYGYMSTLYTSLSDKTLQETVFQNVDNANQFYDLDLRGRITDAYKFDRNDPAIYQSGMDFKDISPKYTSLAGGLGTVALADVLLGVLTMKHDIPLWMVITGVVAACLVGCGAACVAYYKVVPRINKRRYLKAVQKIMADLEQEMYKWVDGVVDFYNTQVDELKKTL